jgi:hypothetical protein
MSVPDYVPTFARLTDSNTQWTSQCHWRNKSGKNSGQRCGNSISDGDVQKRTTLISTLRSLIPSGTTKANISNKTDSFSGPPKILETLETLSELLLCKRRHRIESAAIYAKWSVELEQINKSSSPPPTKSDIRKELNIEDARMHLCQGMDSKGVRCTNSISTENRESASAIIDVVTNCRDSSPATRDNLMVVAELLMCQKYHQGQATEKAESWFKRIQKLFPPATPPEPRLSGSRPLDATKPSTTPQPSTPPSTRTSNQNPEIPEPSISSNWSRASSTKVRTSITSPQSGRQFDAADSPHRSPDLTRSAITATNTGDSEPLRVAHQRVTRSTTRQYERGYLPPEPAPSRFVPFHSPSKENTFLKDLHTKVTSPLTTTQKKSGYIYGFQRVGANYIKIGYTCDTVQSRVQIWERQCNQKLAIVFAEPVPHASKLESLIHLSLYHERRSETRCNGCEKRHIEWFEVTLKRAKQVLRMWKAWIETEPYDEDGNLKPVWTKHIERFRMDKMNSSLESWWDWIDITILAKDMTVDVKKEFIEDKTIESAPRVTTEKPVSKKDVKDEEVVKTAANIQEFRQGLSRLNRNLLESIVKLKVGMPEGRPLKTYPLSRSSYHIGDSFTVSPVTAAAA